nr:hypothetical protein [Phytohabitans suffuscus]
MAEGAHDERQHLVVDHAVETTDRPQVPHLGGVGARAVVAGEADRARRDPQHPAADQGGEPALHHPADRPRLVERERPAEEQPVDVATLRLQPPRHLDGQRDPGTVPVHRRRPVGALQHGLYGLLRHLLQRAQLAFAAGVVTGQ